MSENDEKLLNQAILACARDSEEKNEVAGPELAELSGYVGALLGSYLVPSGVLTKWLYSAKYSWNDIDKWVFKKEEGNEELQTRIAGWTDRLTAALLRQHGDECGCWVNLFSALAESEALKRCQGDGKKKLAAHHLTTNNIDGQENLNFRKPKGYVRRAILGDFYFGLQQASVTRNDRTDKVPAGLAGNFGYSMFRAIFETPNGNPVVLGRILKMVKAGDGDWRPAKPVKFKRALIEVGREELPLKPDETEKWAALSHISQNQFKLPTARYIMICKTCSLDLGRIHIVNPDKHPCLDPVSRHEVFKKPDSVVIEKGYRVLLAGTDGKLTDRLTNEKFDTADDKNFPDECVLTLKKFATRKRYCCCPNGHYWIVKGKENTLKRCPCCPKPVSTQKPHNPIIYCEVRK